MKIIFTAKTFIEGNFILKEPVQVLYCFYKINVKEKGKVNDNTAKMQSTNQLGV